MQNKEQIEKMVKKAYYSRLLPTLINCVSTCQVNNKFQGGLKRYAHNKYKQFLRVPQIYSFEEAKSDRERLIEKVQKVKKNQLPIQYVNMKKDYNGRLHPTFKDNRLQQIKIQTFEEFKIFSEFNEANFKGKVLDHIFEDQLEHDDHQFLYNPQKYNDKKELRKKLNTVSVREIDAINKSRLQTQNLQTKNLNISKKVRKNIRFQAQFKSQQKSRSRKSKNHSDQKYFKKVQNLNDIQEIRNIFNKIGGQKVKNLSILTKKSFIKYIKKFYERPYRIVDFLEIKPLFTFQQYAIICKRIKVMQLDHLYFLTFLFYDTNNDGFICETDIGRLYQLCKILPILHQDYNKLISFKNISKLNQTPKYLQLYNSNEITQSLFFNWRRKNEDIIQETKSKEFQQIFETDPKILNLQKKKFCINFDEFKKLFKGIKTMFWYQLLYRLTGIKYEDFTYTY